jgi:hypothetical protein
MNIQEILQMMGHAKFTHHKNGSVSGHGKTDENGDTCKNGHVMHNIHFEGAPILIGGDHILGAALQHPRRFTLAPSKESMRIKELKAALLKLINIAEECDSWESFPQKPLNEAYDCVKATPAEAAK